MKEDLFHEILCHLEQVREDLSHGAQNGAVEGVDQAIAILRCAYEETGDKERLSNREPLTTISKIVGEIAPIASLIDTILKRL